MKGNYSVGLDSTLEAIRAIDYKRGVRDGMTKKERAHRKAEKAYAGSMERDLKRAAELLRTANPDNRQWMEARDAFLEEIGLFMEPKE